MGDRPETEVATTETSPPNASKETESESDLSGLEDEDDATLAALQSARISELQAAASTRASAAASASPYSSLRPFTSEKAAMHTIAAAPLAVIVFTHPDFPLCAVMAEHLDRIAGLYARAAAGSGNEDVENVVWINMEAEKAGFLTDRLRIRVLPCVVGYRKGEECGRLVGFEGMRKRAQKPGGWRDVAGCLRDWGILGKEPLVGEEEGSDEDAEDDAGEEEQGRNGSWIGGRKSNQRFSTKGTGKSTADDDDDDDDWD